jgi:hypothetical protein
MEVTDENFTRSYPIPVLLVRSEPISCCEIFSHIWVLTLHLECCTEIWDALRAAAEADIHLAQAIVDSAGIIVQSEDLSTCYDERGIGSMMSICTLFCLVHFGFLWGGLKVGSDLIEP